MANDCTHSPTFKRQVVQEYLAGAKLYSLARRHDLSLTVIRTWVDQYLYPSQGSHRCESDAGDGNVEGNGTVQDSETATVERLTGPGDTPLPEDPE